MQYKRKAPRNGKRNLPDASFGRQRGGNATLAFILGKARRVIVNARFPLPLCERCLYAT
jgi:hypothetical protein